MQNQAGSDVTVAGDVCALKRRSCVESFMTYLRRKGCLTMDEELSLKVMYVDKNIKNYVQKRFGVNILFKYGVTI